MSPCTAALTFGALKRTALGNLAGTFALLGVSLAVTVARLAADFAVAPCTAFSGWKGGMLQTCMSSLRISNCNFRIS